MLVVDVNRENFEYDVHAIVQAFYPEEQVKVLTPETGEEKRSLLQEKIRFRIREEGDSVLCTLDDREYCWKAAGEKEGFKRFLYLTLSQMTGRTLPWGNLTGIRPTKIAYGMLDQGKSEEEIVDFYRQKYFVSEEKARLSVDIARRERTLLAGIRQIGRAHV